VTTYNAIGYSLLLLYALVSALLAPPALGPGGGLVAGALYLLFIWLLSAVGGAWMAERKGYGERFGLTCGLLLSIIGLAIVLLLPSRPGSKWRLDGPIPKRGQRMRSED